MAAIFAFLGMLLLSMVVSLLAALQLGDFFGANNELVLVVAGVLGFAVVAIAVFAAGYAAARRAAALNWLALLLAVLALAPVALPNLIQKIADHSTNPYTVGIENTYITLELVIPALLTVLVQWGLVRRRWLRTAGDEDMTLWPWATTTIASFAILNPVGLAFLQATLQHSKSDFMWEFTATLTAAALGALLVMAWIECYIRERVLRRRLAASAPAGETKAPG